LNKALFRYFCSLYETYMEKLFEKSFRKTDGVPLGFQRYLMTSLSPDNRMIGVKGARGTGKTTMLLQYARMHLPVNTQTLYLSLDDFYFTENKLQTVADNFVKQGGKYLLIDEVHRYPGWSLALKNLYDDHTALHIVFTGSSILHLSEAPADLSRRAVMFELPGLSFREYLNLNTACTFEAYSLSDILTKHNEIARQIVQIVRPYEYFSEYLQSGYYPYFLENTETYLQKLAETINLALTYDLPAGFDISFASIDKLRQLIYIIAQSVPFQPNISKLSERIGVGRNTLIAFFKYLEDLRVIRRLYSAVHGIGALQKPDKILMHHPNLQFALVGSEANKGSLRESFFVNQLTNQHLVNFSKDGDFEVDATHVFEVGGRKKSTKQIRHLPDSYVVADDLEIGSGNKIPLWLFGFLY
jgi:uncharacterized protein